MFTAKRRYTFSERLVKRERRRRRVKRICFLALFAFACQTYFTGAKPWSDDSQEIASNAFSDFIEHASVIPTSEASMVSSDEEIEVERAQLQRHEVPKIEEVTPEVVTPEPVVPEVIASITTAPEVAIEEVSAPEPAIVEPLLPVSIESDVHSQTYARLAKLTKEATDSGEQELSAGTTAHLTIDADLQSAADEILKKYRVPWGAVVALEPSTGRILAMSSHSSADPRGPAFALRAGMPAASLFKIITAAAAIELTGMDGDSEINFRGGNYTLNKWNYKPNDRSDSRVITLRNALAKSCNPAFGRVGLKVLSDSSLEQYAHSFGFNQKMHFELPVADSSYATVESPYTLARTAAGFGDVRLGPIHAAMIAASIGNGGVMMRPQLVDKITDSTGTVLRTFAPQVIARPVLPTTATTLLDLMEETVDSGTARRQFRRGKKQLSGIRVAAKTGTLSGDQPAGRYHWLVAVAPIENPQIALASVVVDPGNAKINGTALGRLVLQEYFADK